MQKVSLQEIMTTDLVTIRFDEIVTQVAQIFKKQSFHHIPVVDENNHLAGIISKIDFERIKNGATLFRNPKVEKYNEILFQTLLVKDMMTKTVVSFKPTDSIRLAYLVFKENKFRAIPILEKEKLVGIVTPLDLLDYFFRA